MSKHTPGPWRLELIDSGMCNGAPIGARIFPAPPKTGPVIAEVGSSEANARLIAAAPDLLAACKMVTEMAVAWAPLTPGDISEVRAAIAKAEGK